jgi:hypothetical protein
VAPIATDHALRLSTRPNDRTFPLPATIVDRPARSADRYRPRPNGDQPNLAPHRHPTPNGDPFLATPRHHRDTPDLTANRHRPIPTDRIGLQPKLPPVAEPRHRSLTTPSANETVR